MENSRQRRQERRQLKRAARERTAFPLQNAAILLQSGKASQAAEILENLISESPESYDALILLGIIRATLGNPDAAIHLFERAVQINPGNSDAYFNLAIACGENGRIDDAIRHYHRSLEIDPKNEASNINLGHLLRDNNDLIGAVDCYNRALEINPENAMVHSDLGNALVGLVRLDEAVAAYHHALEINPNRAPILSNLGNALEAQGRLDDAATTQERVIEIDPGYSSAYCSLGIVYYKLGRLDDSVTIFQRALAIDPDIADVWDHLMFAIQARRFSKAGDGDAINLLTEGLGKAARTSINFVMLEYYLQSFRPHEADEIFQKTLGALPSKTVQEIVVKDAGDSPTTHPQLPENMIALLHYGRSGTGLIHSLIDGHPEILTLPSIYLRGYFKKGVWEQISAEGWRRLPKLFADEFAVLFDATSPKPTPGRLGEDSILLGQKEGMTCVGENRAEALSVERNTFCVEAHRLIYCFEKIDLGIFLEIIHAAFEKAMGTKDEKQTIFYHIHNPADFTKLNFLRYKPNARLLMMVREPIQNFESWARSSFQVNDYDRLVHKIIALLVGFDQPEFRIYDSVGVRLEDLKERPDATMRSLSSWLGVKEHPCLYEMTAQGKKWWGDPTSPDYDKTEAMSPFGKESTKRPIGTILSKNDQFVLQTLFYPFSVRFGYREPDSNQFDKDLRAIQPMINDSLDFEKELMERSRISPKQLKRSGAYLLLRACFSNRWDVLNEFKDYPHILKPLEIE